MHLEATAVLLRSRARRADVVPPLRRVSLCCALCAARRSWRLKWPSRCPASAAFCTASRTARHDTQLGSPAQKPCGGTRLFETLTGDMVCSARACYRVLRVAAAALCGAVVRCCCPACLQRRSARRLTGCGGMACASSTTASAACRTSVGHSPHTPRTHTLLPRCHNSSTD